jgi:hypothetical protein
VGLLLDIDEGARNQFCYVAQAATPTRLLRFGPASTEEKRRSNPGDLMTTQASWKRSLGGGQVRPPLRAFEARAHSGRRR